MPFAVFAWTGMVRSVLAFVVVLLCLGAPSRADGFNPRRGINFESWQRWTNRSEFLAPWYDRTNFPDWTKQVDDARLGALRRQGFDFVRLNVDPSPLFWDESETDRLIDRVVVAVRRLQGAGFAVVVDLHLVPEMDDRPFGLHSVLGTGGLQATNFDRFLGVIGKFAGKLAGLPAAATALELVNEPDQDWFSYVSVTDRWPDQLAAMHRVARKAAPNLALVMSGSRSGGVEGLLRVDPRRWAADPNLIWSFHIYDPYQITHSGLPWEHDAQHFLLGLPFPAEDLDARRRQRLITEARTRIDAEVADPAAREKLAREVVAKIDEYVASKAGAAAIGAEIGRVATWARRYGIAPGRILMGEFGVFQDHVDPVTRAAILRATREAAETAGFAWAVYTAGLTPPRRSFGVVDNAETLAIDARTSEALGLR